MGLFLLFLGGSSRSEYAVSFSRGAGETTAPAFGLQAFEVFAHLSEDDIHVVVALARVFGANAVDFREDFVFFHGL